MRIIEIVLQTNRLDEMKSFYGELLGFPIEQESVESFTIITGESKITFQKPVCDLSAYYHFAFTIPSNKLAESKQWLQKKGISCFSNDNQDQFFFLTGMQLPPIFTIQMVICSNLLYITLYTIPRRLHSARAVSYTSAKLDYLFRMLQKAQNIFTRYVNRKYGEKTKNNLLPLVM
ncbi:VOC family protein [Brevibacillus laterosporus]